MSPQIQVAALHCAPSQSYICAHAKPRRMNTCESTTKQRTLTAFKMNTCKKRRGGTDYGKPTLPRGWSLCRRLALARPARPKTNAHDNAFRKLKLRRPFELIHQV